MSRTGTVAPGLRLIAYAQTSESTSAHTPMKTSMKTFTVVVVVKIQPDS